jgi:hypothetical protein
MVARTLAGLLLAGTFAGGLSACGGQDARTPGTGRLVFDEKATPGAETIGGAAWTVRVSRTFSGAGRVSAFEGIVRTRVRIEVDLPPATYEITAEGHLCSGRCETPGPIGARCEVSARVIEGKSTRITLRLRPGRSCALDVRD